MKSLIEQIALFKQEAQSLQEEEKTQLQHLLNEAVKEYNTLEKEYQTLHTQYNKLENQLKGLLCMQKMN